MANWHINGQYMETCNCTYLCPCIGSNLAAPPTEGDCKAAIVMCIDEGIKDGVKLDGLSVIALLYSPGPMAEGNMKVGFIIDEKADDAQTQALLQICSGAEGGPMAGLVPLISENAGVEKHSIVFEAHGLKRSVKAGDLVDHACTGVPSPVVDGEPVYLDNTLHPVAPRIALARAEHSRFHAFGVDWEDASGLRNGHFAPFSWTA